MKNQMPKTEIDLRNEVIATSLLNDLGIATDTYGETMPETLGSKKTHMLIHIEQAEKIMIWCNMDGGFHKYIQISKREAKRVLEQKFFDHIVKCNIDNLHDDHRVDFTDGEILFIG